MLELTGKYNMAKVFTDNIDATTISQIINLLNHARLSCRSRLCYRNNNDHSGQNCSKPCWR